MKVNNNSNTSQAFWIAAGQLIALILTIGSTMVLSRFMDKYNYGTYKQVFYVYSTLLAVFTLGLPKSYGYFLPRISKEEGRDFVIKATKIFIVMGACFSLVLLGGAPFIAELLNNEDLVIALRLFSPVPIFLMPTLGLESIYASYRETHMAALYLVVSRILLFVCVSTPVLFINSSYWGPVLGFVISSFISFLLAIILIRKLFNGLRKQKTTITVKDIIYYSLPIMGAGIFNMLINSTDQFFISRYFGTEAFADFSNGAMELPFVGMIVGACSTVLLPVYSSLGKDSIGGKTIVNTWNNVLQKTVILIYPVIIYCMIYSDEIMVLLYGDQYLHSGKYFFIMLFNNFVSIISCYPLLLALNKTKEYGAVYACCFFILAISEFTVIKIFSSVESICVISVVCLWLRTLIFMLIIAKSLHIKLIQIIPISIIIKVVFLSVLIGMMLHNLIHIEACLLNISTTFPLFLIICVLISKLIHIDYLSIVKPLLKR